MQTKIRRIGVSGTYYGCGVAKIPTSEGVRWGANADCTLPEFAIEVVRKRILSSTALRKLAAEYTVVIRVRCARVALEVVKAPRDLTGKQAISSGCSMARKNKTYARTLLTCALSAAISATPFLVNERLFSGIRWTGSGVGDAAARIGRSRSRDATLICMFTREGRRGEEQAQEQPDHSRRLPYAFYMLSEIQQHMFMSKRVPELSYV